MLFTLYRLLLIRARQYGVRTIYTRCLYNFHTIVLVKCQQWYMVTATLVCMRNEYPKSFKLFDYFSLDRELIRQKYAFLSGKSEII